MRYASWNKSRSTLSHEICSSEVKKTGKIWTREIDMVGFAAQCPLTAVFFGLSQSAICFKNPCPFET